MLVMLETELSVPAEALIEDLANSAELWFHLPLGNTNRTGHRSFTCLLQLFPVASLSLGNDQKKEYNKEGLSSRQG
jgi:hypothetical protein